MLGECALSYEAHHWAIARLNNMWATMSRHHFLQAFTKHAFIGALSHSFLAVHCMPYTGHLHLMMCVFDIKSCAAGMRTIVVEHNAAASIQS